MNKIDFFRFSSYNVMDACYSDIFWKDSAMEDKRYQTTSDFILREIGEEAVLVPVGAAGDLENSIISLNETYTFLWKQYEQPVTLQEVFAAAHAVYEDPEGLMDRHIAEASAEFLRRGIIEEVS